jgi:plasmid stabilization system protein ParE
VSLSVSISGRAEADLTHQYRWYLDNATVQVAERFLASFDATTIKLARQPGCGRRLRFRASELAGLRSVPVGGRFSVHLVFYRSDGGLLNIERVMHGARDLPRRLLEPPEDQLS